MIGAKRVHFRENATCCFDRGHHERKAKDQSASDGEEFAVWIRAA
jgi:hypothetical protein